MAERLAEVRPSWVAFGWFIAIAITALVILVLTVAGFVQPESRAERLWVSVSMGIGFGLAGIIVGMRVAAAPILHGVAIALFSVVAWAALNLFLGEPTGVTAWDEINAGATVTLLALQIAAAVAGTVLGVRRIRR